MKILHINDLAGVAGTICKYLRKAGHEADCISFMDDPFGFDKFYGYRTFKDQIVFRHFLRYLMPQYDIIHLHYPFTFLNWLYANTEKPIVMHYHGTDIALNSMDARIVDGKCKAILVAGEQLLQYHHRAQWLPTIVDMEHFKPTAKGTGYFTFKIPYLKQVQLEGVPLEVLERDYSIKYSDMPALLNKYGGYIDVRIHKQRGLLTDLSKTALEALACGLKVYCNDRWHTELPEHHKPEAIVHKLLTMYEEVLGK